MKTMPEVSFISFTQEDIDEAIFVLRDAEAKIRRDLLAYPHFSSYICGHLQMCRKYLQVPIGTAIADRIRLSLHPKVTFDAWLRYVNEFYVGLDTRRVNELRLHWVQDMMRRLQEMKS